MSSDGGDGDEVTIYGYQPGSIEPYVSGSGCETICLKYYICCRTPLQKPNRINTFNCLIYIIFFPMCNVTHRGQGQLMKSSIVGVGFMYIMR